MFADSALTFDPTTLCGHTHIHMASGKKKGAFSVPSVADIKEASKIGTENKPTIFEVDKTSNRSAPDTSSAGHGEASSSSSHQNTTVQPPSYHPHAILVNPIQVGKVTMNFDL